MKVSELIEKFTKTELLAVDAIAAVRAIRFDAREKASRDDIDVGMILGMVDAALDRVEMWRRFDVWSEAGEDAALAGALLARIAALERLRGARLTDHEVSTTLEGGG
jgi:hypothetical protein